MTTPAPRFRRARRGSLLALSALTLVTACESTLPTAGEVERMDVAALEARTTTALPKTAETRTRFFVNGRELTEAEAKGLPAAKIARIEVAKGPKAMHEVRIVTTGSDTIPTGSDTLRAVRIVQRQPMVQGQPLDAAILGAQRASGDTNTAVVIGKSTALGFNSQPLLIVDGERAPQEALSRFTPDQILSIEVFKGPAAAKIYGPEGAKGVIVVITQRKK